MSRSPAARALWREERDKLRGIPTSSWNSLHRPTLTTHKAARHSGEYYNAKSLRACHIIVLVSDPGAIPDIGLAAYWQLEALNPALVRLLLLLASPIPGAAWRIKAFSFDLKPLTNSEYYRFIM